MTFLLLSGIAGAVLSMTLFLRMVRVTSDDSFSKLLLIVFTPIIILPFSFVAFVFLLIPSHRITFPPDLLTGSIIFGAICLLYSVLKLTNTAVVILRRKAKETVASDKRLKKLSLTDVFTGLYNKRGFITLIEHQMRLAKRNKKKVFLFYVVVNDIERIQNTLGYQERDVMLIETARLLKTNFRYPDIIARVAEDRFMVFLVGADENASKSVSEKFRQKVESYNAKRNAQYLLPISFCVVHYNPACNHIFDNMMAQADEFMSENRENIPECLVEC